jgi:hypothetical protein
LVAFEGYTVAVKVSVPPTVRLKVVLLRVTPVTEITELPGGGGVVAEGSIGSEQPVRARAAMAITNNTYLLSIFISKCIIGNNLAHVK